MNTALHRLLEKNEMLSNQKMVSIAQSPNCRSAIGGVAVENRYGGAVM